MKSSFPSYALLTLISGIFSSAVAQSDNTPVKLEPVRVIGAQERADGPVYGYRATRSSTATRTDTPVEDIPRSISIIPAEVMEDLGAERMDRALDFAGGVTRGNNFGGIDMSSTNLRGFNTSSQYRNGMPVAGSNRGFRSSPDAANIERVEVLKGPASGLFGRGEPGGLINVVTKTPQPEAFTRVKLSAGSWERYRGTLDVNTPLNEAGSVLARFNLALEDNDSFRDHMENQRWVLYPSLSWQLSASTLLRFNAELLRHDHVFDRGIPAVNGKFGKVSIHNFYGEPSEGKIRNNNQLLQVVLEHLLNDDWKLRLSSQYYNGTLKGGATMPSAPLAATPEIVPRSYSYRDFQSDSISGQFDVTGKFEWLGLAHEVLLGAEYERSHLDMRIDSTGAATNAYGVNIWRPRYGAARPAFNPARRSSSMAREASYAFNVQDQIHFSDSLIGQFGARYDNLTPESDNRVTQVKTKYHRDAIVPRAGLVYKVTPEVRLFSSASTSFQSNGIDSQGKVYAPEKGVGYEAGLKLNLFDGRLGATFGAFHITKKNVKTPHPDPSVLDSITVGEQRSRGVDMQLSGEINHSLRVIAAYAFVDAEVTKDTRSNYVGNLLAGVPRHNASLFAVYRFPGNTVLSGSEIGAAFSYVGARRASVASDFELPSYRTVDLFARWQPAKNVNLTLNLNNLFNKEYYERGWSTYAGVPGEPRNVKLTVSFEL